MVYILFAILLFGILVILHELGHFLAAKAFGVRVNEFSVGMGPRLCGFTRGETEYSLRLVPLGGYCALEGEEEETDDPRSLRRQKAWKQFIIFVAGAAMNLLTGFVMILCLYSSAQAFYTADILSLNEGFPQQGEDGLLVGDRIYAINGERVYVRDDVELILQLGGGRDETLQMTVLRGGRKLTRTLTKQTYTAEDGSAYRAYGFTYGGVVEATLARKLQYSWYNTIDFVRLVRFSLRMIVSGAAGVRDLSGPVGIVSTINEVGKTTEAAAGFGAAVEEIVYFGAMIAVNLAVMNLLPLPALDGGHVLFLAVNVAARRLFRREIPEKYLGAINAVGMVALLALMAVVTLQDIIKLF